RGDFFRGGEMGFDRGLRGRRRGLGRGGWRCGYDRGREHHGQKQTRQQHGNTVHARGGVTGTKSDTNRRVTPEYASADALNSSAGMFIWAKALRFARSRA